MSWKSKYGKINLEVFRYGIFDKKADPDRRLHPTRHSARFDGNWVGPISRLAPEYRKYVKKPASKKKTTKAKPKKK